MQAKFRWGRVHAIYGRPFGGGRTPLQSAENFISEFGGDLFGLDSNTELVLGRVTWPAAGEGPAYVHFHQEYAGRPLDGAHLSLTIANREGYPITLASGFIHPTPGPYLRARQRTREQTIQIARDLFGERDVSIDRITEIIWPVGKAPEYGWTMDVTPADAPHDGERITVGTFDGRVLRRRGLLERFGTWTATVTGEKSKIEQDPRECDTSIDPTDEINLADVTVTIDPGGPDEQIKRTDTSGKVTFSDVPATFSVTAGLENLRFKLLDASNGDNLRVETGDETKTLYEFTDANQDQTVEMVNAWKWLNFASQWVEDLDSSYSLGSLLTFSGNESNCLAFYDPNQVFINLSNPDPSATDCTKRADCRCGCPGGTPVIRSDYHYNTIIVHEYGHHLVTQEYPGASSTSATYKEAMPDTISAFVTGESKIGAKICACQDGDLTQELDNTLVWPTFSFSARPGGRAFAGAYWDMRSDLSDNDLAGKILLHGIKKEPIGIDPTVAFHAVLVDDDSGVNGNGDDVIANGSPNYETINAAFRAHGLATQNAFYVDIDWSGSAPGDVADDEDLDVAVTVDPGSLTLVDCTIGPPCPAVLRWRKNSGTSGPGAWTAVDMDYRSGPDDYHASISSSNYSVGDVLDFYVRVEVTDADKQYTCFPTQAQFDWSTPNGDNIPEERDFSSVLVTDQAKVIALSNDLQTDPSWTVGTDEWEFGAPNLEDLGQQPGNDYPFDNDAHQGTPAPNCYFTNTDFSVSEEWDLTTETFDLSDGDIDFAVVSYALWFYARQATVTQDLFRVLIKDSAGETHTIQTIDVEEAGDDDEKLVRWIRQRIKVTPGTGIGEVDFGTGMTLTFRTKEGTAIVEAVVDEVRVWGVKDQ